MDLNDTKGQESPSQTAGPYVHIGCTPNASGIKGVWAQDLGSVMVDKDTSGDRITIRGSVIDGTGAALTDTLVEIWQADAGGICGANDPRGPGDPHFSGFGRSAGDMETGEFRFDTIRPGPVPSRDGSLQAPHISFWIVARGINTGLHTRLYFPEDTAAHANDPVLSRIEHRSRIPTLIAKSEGAGVYRFDIRLQGEDETIFFDI